MLTYVLILVLLPLTFLSIVVKTLFSPAELAEMGVYVEDAWNSPIEPPTMLKRQPELAKKINPKPPSIQIPKSQMDSCAPC